MTTKLPGARAVRVGRAPPERPPRAIPLRVRANLRLGGAGIQMWWLVTLAGVGLCMAVIPRVRMNIRHFDRVILGTMTERSDSRIQYEFTTPEGSVHAGTGTSIGDPHNPDGTLTIWYDSADPDRSDLRQIDEATVVGPGSLLLLAFPAGTFILALVAMALRRRELRLMRYGRVATGTFANYEGGDDRSVYVSFEFTIDGEPATATNPSHTTHVLTRRSGQIGQTITLLYDPADPDRAIALDELPGKPVLDGDRFTTTTMPSLVGFAIPLATAALTIALVVKSV